jgi:hypothetical protein
VAATTSYKCSICDKDIEFWCELVRVGDRVRINGIVRSHGYYVNKFVKTCKHNYQRNGYCYTSEKFLFWYPKIKQDPSDG